MRSFVIVRQTWLSRPPNPWGAVIAAVSTLALTVTTLAYWSDVGAASKWMPASRAAVFENGEYWRLWTTLFAHADLGHLLSNSFFFFVLGALLAGYFGSWVFPWSALATGGLTNAIALLTYARGTNLIGASGVVSWMGGVWLVLYILLYRQKSVGQRLLRAGGVTLVLFMPAEAFDPTISYRTHLIGFAVGVVSGGLCFLLKRKTFRAAEVRETVIEDESDSANSSDGAFSAEARRDS